MLALTLRTLGRNVQTNIQNGEKIMANHKTFSEQDVINAANELKSQNKPINGNSLRRLVGSGRPSTLIEMYESLVTKGNINVPVITEESDNVTMECHDLPSEIKEELELGLQAISNMISRCNDIAHHVVESRLNKAVEEAKDARIAAETLVEEAAKREEQAYEEAETYKDEIEVLDANVTDLDKQNVSITHQLETSTNKIDELQAQLDAANKALIKVNKDLAKADKNNNESEAKYEVALQYLEEAKKEVNSLKNEAKKQNETIINQTKDLGEANGKVTALTEQLTETKTLLNTTLTANFVVNGDKHALEEKLSSAEKKLAEYVTKEESTNGKKKSQTS